MKTVVKKSDTSISVQETIPERVVSVDYSLDELFEKKVRLQKAIDQTQSSLNKLNSQMVGIDNTIDDARVLGVQTKEEIESKLP